MEQLMEFLAMGGYAAFVWPAYAIAAVIMAGLTIDSWRGLAREKATLEKLQAQSGNGRGK